MSYKIYKKGAYVVIDDTANGTTKEFNSADVQINKNITDKTLYNVLANGLSVLSNIGLASILDENGDAYTETPWDAFRHEQCGVVNTSDVVATAAGVTYDNATSGLTATDVQAAIDELVASPASEYTETIVDISSAQILAMDVTPIFLLPTPETGQYYDVVKVIFEYTHITTPYNTLDPYFGVSNMAYLPSSCLTTSGNKSYILTSVDGVDLTNGVTFPFTDRLATPAIQFFTWNSEAPTLGDGTLRVKIYHKTITFGA